MIYDIIIVGGGIAGLSAAIEAKAGNNKVAIITKGNIFKSNSSLASGGMNAVLNNKLSDIQKHIDDTIKGAKGLGDEKAISYMCKEAGATVHKLEYYGVDFAKTKTENIAQRGFGGTKEKRTCYVGDKTGSAITAALIKKAKALGIDFVVNHFVLDLARLGKRVSGIVALRKLDSSVIIFPAKAVVFAGGGYAGIYRGHSTNAADYTGDLLAIALKNGLALKDMEFVQFHPTGLNKTSYLVSEAARGEGGYLVNSDGERFVDELETRDVVSRAILKQLLEGKKVFLDLRHLSQDTLENKLPSLYKAAMMQAGVDIASELLPVMPVAHYSMGGIANKMTKTSIEGLFVCGECAATGVHGANRLGGNSLLEGAVFGNLAGNNALKFATGKKFLPVDYEEVVKHVQFVDKTFSGDTTKNFNAVRVSMGNVLFEKAGILRDGKRLQEAHEYMSYLRRECAQLYCIDKSRQNNVELTGILELKNALEIAEAVILSALMRKESRGAHYRTDCVKTDESLQKSIVVKKRGSLFKVEYEKKGLFNRLRAMLIN
jgi:succinate dehydrogenase/fumarate reductase flavoprotein subunit